MKNVVVRIPPWDWAWRPLWWQKGFSDFSLRIHWFSLGTLQNSIEEMNGVERLFIGNRWIKGNNSSTLTLMAGFLKIPADNCPEKMESHSVGLNRPIIVQGSQWVTQRDAITKQGMLRFSSQTMVLLVISTTTRTGGQVLYPKFDKVPAHSPRWTLGPTMNVSTPFTWPQWGQAQPMDQGRPRGIWASRVSSCLGASTRELALVG